MSQKTQIYLAPFQGITGTIYRETFARHFGGVDKMLTPFLQALSKKATYRERLFELEKTALKHIEIVPQILSKDADEIISFETLRAKRFLLK